MRSKKFWGLDTGERFSLHVSGIYKISAPDGRAYIGQSGDISARLGGHRRQLKAGSHTNRLLQAMYDEYGMDGLTFDIIYVSKRSDYQTLLKLEAMFIKRQKPSCNNPIRIKNETDEKWHEEFKKKFAAQIELAKSYAAKR